MTKMRRVLILSCGGTIVMQKNEHGFLAPLDFAAGAEILKQLEPRLAEIAQVDLRLVANVDSANLHPSVWDQLIEIMRDNYSDYDGFVITHGTDTMAYTAAALSFALRGLGKPLVVTGAQIPGLEIGSDARANLTNAVRLATMNLSGVFIVFDDRIMLGVRASKVSESRLDAFRSVNTPDAGQIRVEIRLAGDVAPRRNTRLVALPGFEKDIAIITLAPGNDSGALLQLIDSDRLKGLVVRAFGSGNVPYAFEPVFADAFTRKMPVVITSQCYEGVTALEWYEAGEFCRKYGVIESRDMSLEAVVTKLMWSLRRFDYDGVRAAFLENIAGELSL